MPQHIRREPPPWRWNVLLLAGLSALLAVAAFFVADALLARRSSGGAELEVSPAGDAAGGERGSAGGERGSAGGERGSAGGERGSAGAPRRRVPVGGAGAPR
jgi:hypothetical protein